MIRAAARWNTLSITGPISRSAVTKPGDLGVGGVDEEQVDALVAEPGEPGEVGEPPVERAAGRA